MKELTLTEMNCVNGGGDIAQGMVGIGIGLGASAVSGAIAGAIWGSRVGGVVGLAIGAAIGAGYVLATSSGGRYSIGERFR